ncbi:MAG: hypothetical protein KDI03_00475 [Anaerolineae bacterium]|nr:hypothetical protein [Anaerolineae bacterium]MCB0198523.1 hypothetical protein [Anaerolineae bacterium]MCB0203962.1 hypothetical protein [Anaerolineae bacterium]MCB0252242.1 hypothetical protein [Anaerolineae bacterium]
MATFPYDHVITENLQTSAELIVNTRPKEERVDWVAFLMNEMLSIITPEHGQKLLEDVQARIGDRLETGAW